VLYNGKEEFPDEYVYRLSELFEKPESLGLPENAYPLLEFVKNMIYSGSIWRFTGRRYLT